MILIKLGGSVITDKRRYRTFRESTVRRLAREILGSGEKVMIIHGAGSFGHVVAKKYALHLGRMSEEQVKGVAQVSWDVRDLDNRFMKALADEGLDAVSIVPGSAAKLSEGRLCELDVSKFKDYFALGITPVSFGDVVLDDVRGFGICSGDQLMARLAKDLRPRKVIFVTDVDGVFTSDPHMDPDAELLRTIDRGVLSSLPRSERCDDVTGSIFAKLEHMLDMAESTEEVMIINGNVPGRLCSALRGEELVCSRVRSG
ncbi:MAG: isopentenyl phosphate kinase family protein [Methanomassiliicoccales archaeon]|nr:MAG: isopentenyl phosphate kinase family protein [Methanomassiliicoccales archaeon]